MSPRLGARVLHAVITSTLVAGGALVAATTPAAAAPSLVDALGAPAGLVGASFAGDARGGTVVDQTFNDMTGPQALISTGVATDVFAPGSAPDGLLSTNLNPGGKDETSLVLDVKRPAGKLCLAFDYAFGSEEWPTYVGREYNDVLTATSDASGNTLSDPEGRAISVNAIFDMYRTDALPGGKASDGKAISDVNGFMTPLVGQVPLTDTADVQKVKITISDLGDNLLDSVALVDNVRFSNDCAQERGIEGPVPSITGHRGVGSTLTADVGAWTPSPVRNFYRWYRVPGGPDCDLTPERQWIPIPNADRGTYTATETDRGYCLRVRVTGFKNGWVPAKKTSPVAGPIGNGVFTASPPQITGGAAKVGERISVASPEGTWRPEPDRFTYQWLADGTPISGQTTRYLDIPASAAGKSITVRVKAEKPGYDDFTVTSESFGPVAYAQIDPPPKPGIVGDPAFGGTLRVETTDWQPAPVSLSYQWTVDGVPVANATGTSYALRPTDVGKQVTVTVTGRKDGYQSASRTSDPVAVGAGAMTGSDPVVTGAARVGSPLTVGGDAWTPAPDSTTYQWLVDGAAVAGATKASFTPRAEDLGSAVSVRTTSSKPGYATQTRTSKAVTVLAGRFVPGTPTVSGTPMVGQTLRATTGSWTPTASAYTYQWKVDGEVQVGRTDATYVVPQSALGRSVSVEVTGRRTAYDNATVTSDAVSVYTLPITAAAPSVSGDPAVGKRLTVDPGEWEPTGTTLSYQWMLDGDPIDGATATSLVVPESAPGRAITVRVTGSRTGWTSASATSDPVTGVLGTFTAPTPTITGTAMTGNTLRVSTGSWSPTATSFSYRWMVDGEPQVGRTGTSFDVPQAALGKDVTVEVTGRRSGYTDRVVTSAATRIYTLPVEGVRPTISGSPRVGQKLTAHAGDWQPTPVAIAYQWFIDDNPIANETRSTFTVPDIAYDKQVSVRVAGGRTGYTTTVLASEPVDVGPGLMTPGLVNISGGASPIVGSTLSASTRSWSPSTVDMTYTWSVNGVADPKQTTSRFTVPASAVGKRITVTARATRAGWTESFATSAPTAIVARARMSARQPKISGTVKVGRTLKATRGAWRPSTARFTYRWYVNDKPVSGATRTTWKIPRSAKGKRISVKVTATKTGYQTTSLFSGRTAKVR